MVVSQSWYAPTVFPHNKFHPVDDAHVIKKAMKGLGCDSGPIVNVLTKRCIKQRVDISKAYKKEYGRELSADLKSELGGDLETMMVALTCSYYEFLARELHSAFKGAGTKEKVVSELVLTRFNAELKPLKEAYKLAFESDLDEDLAKEVSGDWGDMMKAVALAEREEGDKVDEDKAKEQAEALYDAGENKLGTDEAVFCNLFARQSFPQIAAIAKHYETLSKKSLAEAIKSEMKNPLKDALLTVLSLSRDRVEFYADCLHESMHGMGTDERRLIRVIIVRSELDLAHVKTKFHEKYGKTLEHAIEKDTSGAFKNALIAVVRS